MPSTNKLTFTHSFFLIIVYLDVKVCYCVKTNIFFRLFKLTINILNAKDILFPIEVTDIVPHFYKREVLISDSLKYECWDDYKLV